MFFLQSNQAGIIMGNQNTYPRLEAYQTWASGTIKRDDALVFVRFVPITRTPRFAVDENGNLYEYEKTRKIWHLFREGLHARARKGPHVSATYHEVEAPLLEDIQKRLQALHIDFQGLLSTTPEDEQERMQAHIFDMCAQLGRVRDEAKVRGKEHLLLILPLRDALGRVNQGVFLCRQVVARQSIERRIHTITGIRPRLMYYDAQIAALVQYYNSRIELTIQALIESYRAMGGKTRTSAPDHVKVTTYLRVAYRYVQQLTVMKPYRRTALYTLTDLEDAAAHAKCHNYEAAQSIVVRIGNSMRLKQIQKDIQLILLPMFDDILVGSNPQRTCIAVCTWIDTHVFQRLLDIDETGFVHHVRDDALTLLRSVHDELTAFARTKCITHHDVKRLRTAVQRAAAML